MLPPGRTGKDCSYIKIYCNLFYVILFSSLVFLADLYMYVSLQTVHLDLDFQ